MQKRLIFFGAPGVGKGTIATKISASFQIPHISTGDIFRDNIKRQTELGQQVSAILDKGDLVPDELTVKIIKDRLAQNDTNDGYILDGFPRTIEQAIALDSFAQIDLAILFTAAEKVIVERLSGRRIHKPSGRVYHIRFSPPKIADRDDKTGEPLLQRPDDQPHAIKNRLQVYKTQTEPLVKFYRNARRLLEIDASPDPDSIYRALKQNIS